MSWFSKPFARSLEPQGNISDGDGEDDYAHGQGVKEDLSQLTQTFKRQLWGVASFLAPPPQADYQDKAGVDDDDDGAQSKAPIESRDDFFEELVDVDFDVFLDETLEDKPAEASKGEICGKEHVHGSLSHSSPPNVEQGLIGINRDFAELKGSVATGFSKILRAVREEIEHVESSKSYVDSTSEDEDDDNAEKSTRFKGAIKSQGLNMYLKPLIDNVLHNGKGKEKRENASSHDDDDEGDETDVVKIDNNVRPSNLQDTFIHSLRGISEFASSLISLSTKSDDENMAFEKERSSQVTGLTEEVLIFARNISMHPETWLDFPLLPDDEIDEFEMSAAQKKHIHALEDNCPGLSALKTELCPDCMCENHFWKIYFILLHSHLSKLDASLLSTPKIMQARVHLAQKLEADKEHEAFMGKGASSSESHRIFSLRSATDLDHNQVEELKGRPQTSCSHLDLNEEVQNKDVLASTVKLAPSSFKGAEADADRWLRHKEPLSHVAYAAPGVGDEDDVSFSDLEEDDVQTTKEMGRSSSTQSFDWVQLNKTSSVENFEGLKLQPGSTPGDGTARHFVPRASSSHVSKKQGQSESKSESSDWSTVEEDDATSSDSLPS